MNQPIDPVVIRVWNGASGDVFALFPTLPADTIGRLCTSYQHIGQHDGADYQHCIRNSRPATKAEARELLAELRQRGYNPKVFQRATWAMHAAREKLARQLAAA